MPINLHLQISLKLKLMDGSKLVETKCFVTTMKYIVIEMHFKETTKCIAFLYTFYILDLDQT